MRPDGRQLVAVAAKDGDKVRVWDVGNVRDRCHSGMARGPTDSSSTVGTARIATSGTDGWNLKRNRFEFQRTPAGYAVKIWDAETGREIARFPANAAILGMAFGPDGTTITTLDHENRLQVRETDGGREVANIKGNFPEANRHSGFNRWAAFDAKARRVARDHRYREEPQRPGGNEAVLKLWDVDQSEFRNVSVKKTLELEPAEGTCLLQPRRHPRRHLLLRLRQ